MSLELDTAGVDADAMTAEAAECARLCDEVCGCIRIQRDCCLMCRELRNRAARCKTLAFAKRQKDIRDAAAAQAARDADALFEEQAALLADASVDPAAVVDKPSKAAALRHIVDHQKDMTVEQRRRVLQLVLL